MSHVHFNPNLGSKKAEGPVEGKSKKHPGGPNALMLAFIYLIEIANMHSDSALLKAKQLKANALSQQRLNREAEQLKFHEIPRGNHHSMWWKQGSLTWLERWENKGKSFKRFSKWYEKITWTTGVNERQVKIDISENQETAALRQNIESQLTVLQQHARISQDRIKNVCNEAVQTMQEGSSLMQVLQSLTFKALMRQPVQG